MQQENKKAWLVLTIAIWVVLQQVNAADVTFKLEPKPTQNTYNTFLQSIRSQTKDPSLVYEGIPMIRPPTNPDTYLLVDLESKKDKNEIFVTLALSRNDLYVVAFADKFGGKVRGHFFSNLNIDTIDKAKKVFPEVQVFINITYGESYSQIESNAGTNRLSFPLGFDNLKTYMEKVYGMDTKAKDYSKTEARFLLIAIQMVAEAARFKYIQGRAIVTTNPNNYKILSLENNWGAISKGIRNAVKKVINPALILQYPNGTTWTVTQVSDIKNDMGLLKYVM
ncbi:protein synthesis inhibitor PD-S2-like [Chenopodium quinoa]|uniref:rRNA N-glycosylase n=1 Tax=Chenopodium quinoa TaxID=63459 RepID=A0A803MNS5_CHEQI|nr:protein synthesis inhibitor PD-S2-like [Chenopodium quinoa]